MTKSKDDLRILTDQALDAFWQVVAQRYPEATTGDLAPWPTIQLQIAAENSEHERCTRYGGGLSRLSIVIHAVVVQR